MGFLAVVYYQVKSTGYRTTSTVVSFPFIIPFQLHRVRIYLHKISRLVLHVQVVGASIPLRVLDINVVCTHCEYGWAAFFIGAFQVFRCHEAKYVPHLLICMYRTVQCSTVTQVYLNDVEIEISQGLG